MIKQTTLMTQMLEQWQNINWRRVFIMTTRSLMTVALLFATLQYAMYVDYFGVNAIALIGQYLIGAFLWAVSFHTTDDLQIITAAIGMYLFVNSF